MKNKLHLLNVVVLSLFLSSNLFAQWTSAGQSTANEVYDQTILAIATDGAIYNAFYDNGKISVKYWTGSTNWSLLGSAQFGSASNNFDFDIEGTAFYYVAYTTSTGINLMQYTTNGWVAVGNEYSVSNPGKIKMKSYAGVPYIAYVDASGVGYLIKYSSSTWNDLGTFTETTTDEISLDISLGGQYVMVAFNNGTSRKLSVKAYEYNNNHHIWRTIGNDISTGEVSEIDIKVCSDNTNLKVAVKDLSSSNGLTVYQTVASNWSILGGSPNVTAGLVGNISLVLDSNDDPYVSFTDYSLNPDMASVIKYDATNSWSYIGGHSGLSSGGVYTTSLAIDNDFNLLYLAYDDISSTGSYVKYTSFSPLPVELTSFIANINENSVVLNWETATEVNNYGFEVERQILNQVQNDNNSWETLSFIEGHGNSNSPKYYEFVDDNPLPDSAEYRLKQIDTDGGFAYYDETVQVAGYSTTGVNDGTLPLEYKLSQNHPNPFNPSTQIEFTIPSAGVVKLNIYNVLGEVVSELVNENLEAGFHQYQFKASNLTSGIYFYSISVNGFVEVKKMNLIK